MRHEIEKNKETDETDFMMFPNLNPDCGLQYS